MKTSIIITAFNYGLYVDRCLRSCLEQKHIDPADYEVILVDDASTDNTLEIVEKYRQFPNFRVCVNASNVGVAESANVGIRASLGRYVVRVDADDYISENFAFFLTSYLFYNRDAFGVACDYLLVDDHGNVIRRCYADQEPIACGILYRRDLFVEAGLYNPDFRHREEEELRLRQGDQYRLQYLRMPLYRYRMHNNNKTKLPEYLAYAEKLTSLHSAAQIDHTGDQA